MTKISKYRIIILFILIVIAIVNYADYIICVDLSNILNIPLEWYPIIGCRIGF